MQFRAHLHAVQFAIRADLGGRMCEAELMHGPGAQNGRVLGPWRSMVISSCDAISGSQAPRLQRQQQKICAFR